MGAQARGIPTKGKKKGSTGKKTRKKTLGKRSKLLPMPIREKQSEKREVVLGNKWGKKKKKKFKKPKTSSDKKPLSGDTTEEPLFEKKKTVTSRTSRPSAGKTTWRQAKVHSPIGPDVPKDCDSRQLPRKPTKSKET